MGIWSQGLNRLLCKEGARETHSLSDNGAIINDPSGKRIQPPAPKKKLPAKTEGVAWVFRKLSSPPPNSTLFDRDGGPGEGGMGWEGRGWL